MSTDPGFQQFATANVAETMALGVRLGKALAPGSVVALVGTLGSGKTQLVKGIARGAGVPLDTVVNSPTFVLVHEYAGRLPLFHLDVYRLGSEEEFEALGFDEMVKSGGGVLIEWADRVSVCLPEDHLRIEIEITGVNARQFALKASGPASQGLLDCVRSG